MKKIAMYTLLFIGITFVCFNEIITQKYNEPYVHLEKSMYLDKEGVWKWQGKVIGRSSSGVMYESYNIDINNDGIQDFISTIAGNTYQLGDHVYGKIDKSISYYNKPIIEGR